MLRAGSARSTRHYVRIGQRLALGYRRASQGFGTWQARIFAHDGSHLFFSVGTVDDRQDIYGVDMRDLFRV